MPNKKVNLKSLKAAAMELNEVISLDEPINVEEGEFTYDELKEDVKEVAELLIESDEVSDETLDTIYHLTYGKIGKQKGVEKNNLKKEKALSEEKEKKTVAKKTVAKKNGGEKTVAKKTVAKKNSVEKVIAKKNNGEKKDPDRKICIPLASDVAKVKKNYENFSNGREKYNFRVRMIEDWVSKKKYTKADILDIHCALFPEVAKNTISTFISSCSNEKNNKLDRLIKKNEKGILHF